MASLVQHGTKLRQPQLGSPLPRRRIRFRQPLRDQPRSIRLVIERQHDVIQADGQRRDAEFIELRRWHTFQTAVQIVAEQARRPALKRRQLGHGRGRESGQSLLEHAKRVAPVRRHFDEIKRIRR